MYDWVTTTTIDWDSPYSHIQYIYIYDYDDVVYNSNEEN